MAKINLVNYEIDISTLIPASNRGTMRVIMPDEVVLSYAQYDPEKKRCRKVKVKIGETILKTLKWTIKDKLQMFSFPENLRRVVIIKRGAGCTAITSSTKYPYWQFSLMGQLKFMLSPGFAVDYEIHKLGYIIFNLEDPVVA